MLQVLDSVAKATVDLLLEKGYFMTNAADVRTAMLEAIKVLLGDSFNSDANVAAQLDTAATNVAFWQARLQTYKSVHLAVSRSTATNTRDVALDVVRMSQVSCCRSCLHLGLASSVFACDPVGAVQHVCGMKD